MGRVASWVRAAIAALLSDFRPAISPGRLNASERWATAVPAERWAPGPQERWAEVLVEEEVL